MSTCRQCKTRPTHRINLCRECLRAYARKQARKYYAENFKAEPHEYKKKPLSRDVLAIEKDIRSKKQIRQSLSAKFGAQPEKKYRAADILKTRGE